MLTENDASNAGASITFTSTAPQAGDSLPALLAKLLQLYRTLHGLT